MTKPIKRVLYILLPVHLQDREPDPYSPHRRRFTKAYRRKREVVKYLWMGAGLIVLAKPTVATLIVVGLLMTFLSFTVLDETS